MYTYQNTYHFTDGVILRVGGLRKGTGKFRNRKTWRRPLSKQT